MVTIRGMMLTVIIPDHNYAGFRAYRLDLPGLLLVRALVSRMKNTN